MRNKTDHYRTNDSKTLRIFIGYEKVFGGKTISHNYSEISDHLVSVINREVMLPYMDKVPELIVILLFFFFINTG